jgi:hypothetical protein
MQEGNIKTKTTAIADLSKEQQSNATTRREKSMAITASQQTLKKVLDESIANDFSPFAVNFFCGLFCIITGTLILPREPWKRRKIGNVMNDNIRAQAEQQIGRPLPQGATAFDDGKGSSVVVKNGREYITTVSKRKIGF